MESLNIHQLSTIESYDKSANNFDRTIARLDNYHETYDFLVSLVKDGSTVLDLACGPCNIGRYLLKFKRLSIIGFDLSIKMLELAKSYVPDGVFMEQSIIEFSLRDRVDVVINGFGIPYLNEDQVAASLRNTAHALKEGGFFYLSFMTGKKSGFEKTSFGSDNAFYVYYHDRDGIIDILKCTGFQKIKEWNLDYKETDGSITKDVVLICRK